jgi:hypothetical protein
VKRKTVATIRKDLGLAYSGWIFLVFEEAEVELLLVVVVLVC